MEDITEDISVEKLQKGDDEEFKILIKKIFPAVSIYLKNSFRFSDEIAEDIFQEVLIRTINHLQTFNDFKGLRSWFFTVTRNVALDIKRHKKVEKNYISELSESEIQEIRDSLISYKKKKKSDFTDHNVEIIKKAFEKLSPENKDLIEKRYHFGLKYKEIASLKKKPVGSIKSSLFRIRKKLKEETQDYLIMKNNKGGLNNG